MEQATVITAEGVEAEALRLARSIVDYDRKVDETRRAGDNMRRLIRLDLGAVICSAPDPEHVKQVIIDQTPLSKAEVQDIQGVAAFNLESGYNGYLRDDVQMSFTQNRNLALIRVASVSGSVPTVQERMDALHHCLVRNNGVLKEDKEYRQELRILPPPNSADNIKERAHEDPEFRKEMADKGIVFVFDDDEADDYPDPPTPIDPWVRVANELRATTLRFRDRAFNDPDTPDGMYDECDLSIEDLKVTQELIIARKQMASAERG